MTADHTTGLGRAHSRTNLVLLALTYFLYFGQLGVLVPYLGIFLDGRGFTSSDIGNLFAVITLSRIIGPSIWAGLADRSGKALQILRLGCFLSALCFLLVFFVSSFWGLTLAFGLMMMFWTAVLPQLEVITMQAVAPGKTPYGQVRLWGSVGFILLTVGVGKGLDLTSSELPVYVSLGVLCLLFISALFLHQPALQQHSREETGNLWRFAGQRPFIVFMLSAILLQISFGPYYGFFALYMRDLQYSGQETGLLIALGVLAEIGIFLIASRLIRQFGVWTLLMGCLLLTAFRWYALAAWADSPWIVMTTQLIHALSFGLNHATSVHFIHQYLPGRFHGRGQALYIGIAFGAGGALGNYGAGQIWAQGTNSYTAFALAALSCLAGALVLLLVRPKQMDDSQVSTP
ncbi:MFS transporter [Salinimonas chungwhensis]|uniref:MFS transporter n=1 Tax=Salinimonas chungwhensis TaxID=265425 RepID=UPI00035E313A|nr:MFS transporter [Salinimonas chungwhensis]